MSRTIAIAGLAVLLTVSSLRAAAADKSPDGTALLMRLVTTTDDPSLQLDILRGVHAALEGRRNVPAPQGWDDVYGKLGRSGNAELRSLTRAVAAIYGDPKAIGEMKQALADPAADVEERRSVLRSLLTAGEPSLSKALHGLVADPNLGGDALSALAAYDDTDTPKVILEAYPKLDANVRKAALNTLAARLAYAKPLVAAVREGRVPKQDVTAYTVRQLRDLGDKDLDAFVNEVYGVAREAAADKAQLISQYKAWLTDDRIAKANPSRGRAVFARTCSQCHTLFGAGGTVGPDLTGSQRTNTDYVLQNVVDPGALIAKEYQVTLIRTKDKRVVSGIATESAESYKVVTETGTVFVQKSDVDKVRKSDLSMMPEGLLSGLAETETADLLAYLRAPSQVPLAEK
jgi:putative heme-binding domain-containing protein